MFQRRIRQMLVVGCALLAAACLSQTSALAVPVSAPVENAVHQSVLAGTTRAAGPVRLADPGAVLPPGWRHSADEAVTVAGDGSGLHVLAASEASGYTWRSVATLGDPAVETNLWIGQACVTGSGRYAVVVYAPEQVTNMAGAQGVLARAAVVNLRTGAVRQLGGGFSIAYFDPGCGTGTQAVLTEGGWADDTSTAPASTTLAVVDAQTGTISSTVRVAGQVTSAIPYGGQIVGAGGGGLEEITRTGQTRLLAATTTVPFQLAPDASGGLGYQTVAGNQTRLWRLAGGHPRLVASVAKSSVELRQIGGRVWLVGPAASKVPGLPRQWRAVNAPATAQPSTQGTLAVTVAEPLAPAHGQRHLPGAAQPVGIGTQLLTGRRTRTSFEVPATAAVTVPVTAPAAHPGTASPETGGSGSTPVSADRTCAIPIDDPRIQAYQPDFAQTEWAADQAVDGALTDTRPAGLYGSSLPAYKPQGLFPLPSIDGYSGRKVPAQVLLGVLTQESNLQQASTHVIQGQASNPLTSFNWYGNWIGGGTTNTGKVDWVNSDCGYGIAQITSGMCLAKNQNNDPECEYQTPMPGEKQLAVAVDFQANIAAGAQSLIGAWNELWANNIKPDGDTASYGVSSSPDYIDNWYMAVWAYNSGLEPATKALGNKTGCKPGPKCTDGGGHWGLGYADNPIDPAYPPDRPTFPGPSPSGYPAPGGATYSLNWDMSHPQYWPYQEKVLAWAYDAITLWDYSKGQDVQAFAYAHGTYTPPPYDEFCTSADDCDASGIDPTKPTGPDACTLNGDYADHCWWHVEPAPWPITAPTVTCADCGISNPTYAAGAAEPKTEPIAPQFQQKCSESPLPSSAVIVGDGGKAALGCPGQNWTSKGSFSWNFAPDSNGNYSSKIDFDQIGAGFGGHFWFGYTQPNNLASVSSTTPAAGHADRVITGTWKPPSSVTGWTTIEAAIPSYGDDAIDVNYQVDPGGGLATRNVLSTQTANSGTNSWVDLGDFYLGSGAKVSLSNVAYLATGVDIDWSAMAFIHTSAPQVNYVGMGDSFSSGEGNPPYFPDSDTAKDKCHRSMEDAYPMKVTLPHESKPISHQTADGFNFIACSGAETTGVTIEAVNPAGNPRPVYKANTNENAYNEAGNTDWGYEQYKTPWQDTGGPVEGLQENNKALGQRTGLVTISIGGNDTRFSDVLIGCLKAALIKNSCSANGYTLTRFSNKKTDPHPLREFEPIVIKYLKLHLETTYLAINAVAPSADIVVAGYPLLFPANPTTSCDSGSVLGKIAKLSPAAQDLLNTFGTQLNNTISQAVSQVKKDGVDIQFVDPQEAFSGHALCTSDPWLLPLSVTSKVSSFHPNAAGQQAYADLVNKCLAGTLSC